MSSQARALLKPKCENVGKALILSGIIEIVIIVIIFIMLVFAASYNNLVKATAGGAVTPEEKAKYINGLIIASAVISLILVGVGVWHLLVSNNLKKEKCLASSS